jgi:LmbE family N-acetylglucosaminyl deacetylase
VGGISQLIRKGLLLLQSRRSYLFYLEPELKNLFRADLAHLAANLDLYRPLIPVPVGPPKGRVLVVGAHPDDEAVGAGGTLLLARDNGAELKLAFITDGSPPQGDQAEGRRRQEEAGQAAQMLGAETAFFPAPVRSLARERAKAREAADWLAGLAAGFKPQAVLCPFPLDAHSDHRLAAWATARALESLKPGPMVWAYEVASLCPANVVVEISAKTEAKAELIGRYTSQTQEFDYANVYLGLSRFRARHLTNKARAGSGAAEAFFRLPGKGFARLMDSLSDEQLFKDK